MPTINDIKSAAVGRLDAKEGQLAQVINVLPQLNSPERAFRFVLQQFGLERLPVNKFKAANLDAREAEAPQSPATEDNITTMHTGAFGAPPMSIMGTPIFCDMILSAPADKLNTSASDVILQNVIVTVDQVKNIVKTAVQGFDGTVKEYISDGDYQVTIRGVLYNTFRKDYPRGEVQLLLEIFKRKQALDVTSEYLRLFDIHSLVVESFKMGQEMGRQNMQKFEATCSSDLPLLLKRKLR